MRIAKRQEEMSSTQPHSRGTGIEGYGRVSYRTDSELILSRIPAEFECERSLAFLRPFSFSQTSRDTEGSDPARSVSQSSKNALSLEGSRSRSDSGNQRSVIY